MSKIDMMLAAAIDADFMTSGVVCFTLHFSRNVCRVYVGKIMKCAPVVSTCCALLTQAKFFGFILMANVSISILCVNGVTKWIGELCDSLCIKQANNHMANEFVYISNRIWFAHTCIAAQLHQKWNLICKHLCVHYILLVVLICKLCMQKCTQLHSILQKNILSTYIYASARPCMLLNTLWASIYNAAVCCTFWFIRTLPFDKNRKTHRKSNKKGNDTV